MSQTIQIKRGLSTSPNWTTLSLLPGEFAFQTDTKKLYIGDEATNYLINPTLGSAAMANTGTTVGEIPVLGEGGLLSPSVLPSIVVNNTYVVPSQEGMLALAANVGDVAIRTDSSTTYILQKLPATSLASWVQFLTPSSGVSSVNGLNGTVVLGGDKINATGYTIATTAAAIAPTDSINTALGKIEFKVNNTASLASPAFTGTPTAPTAAAATSTTQIATTAFVQSALAVIDGGTF